MIALLLAAAGLCGGLRQAVKQAERPTEPFAAWKGAQEPFAGDLSLFKSKRGLPPFDKCRVAVAKDLSALECELPIEDLRKAYDELQRLIAQVDKCLDSSWEKKHPPIEQKYSLLGISSWKKRAMEVQVYAQAPGDKHLGFPLMPVQTGAVLVLTVTVE